VAVRLNSNGGLVSNLGVGTNEVGVNLAGTSGLALTSNALSVSLNGTTPCLSLTGGLGVTVNAAGGLAKTSTGLQVQTDGTYLAVNGSNQVSVVAGAVGRKVVATISGDGSTTAFAVTHNLNTKDVVVSVRGTTAPYSDLIIQPDVATSTVNAVSVSFATAPAVGVAFSVTVIG
jgi:hypothetical protein